MNNVDTRRACELMHRLFSLSHTAATLSYRTAVRTSSVRQHRSNTGRRPDLFMVAGVFSHATIERGGGIALAKAVDFLTTANAL